MDDNSSTCGGAGVYQAAVSGIKSDLSWQDDIAWLKAEVGELRRWCSLANKESDRLGKGVVELRSMYDDTNKEVKGLKQIMHMCNRGSDDDGDVETDSDDSDYHVIVSGGSARAKKLPSLRLTKVLHGLSEGSSDSGVGCSASNAVEHLQHDANRIGFEEENLISKVLSLEDVVKLLNTEICELEMKYLKAMEDIERLKAASTDLNGGLDDDLVHMKTMKLEQEIREWTEEKFKNLEARIKEFQDEKNQHNSTKKNWLPETNIRASLQDMINCLSHKFHVLRQQFLRGKDLLLLKIDHQYDRFSRGKDLLLLKFDHQYQLLLQGVDRLICKLNLRNTFVQGALFGLGMALLLLPLLYIKCVESQISQLDKKLSDLRREGADIRMQASHLWRESSDIWMQISRIWGKNSYLRMEMSSILSSFSELELDSIDRETRLEDKHSRGVEEMKQLIASTAEQVQALMANLESKPKEGMIKKWISSRAEQYHDNQPGEKSYSGYSVAAPLGLLCIAFCLTF